MIMPLQRPSRSYTFFDYMMHVLCVEYQISITYGFDIDTRTHLFKITGTEHVHRITDERIRIDGDRYAYLELVEWIESVIESKPPLERIDSVNDPRDRRILEINKELDIIRGITATPAGYKIDKSKVRKLIIELKSLT